MYCGGLERRYQLLTLAMSGAMLAYPNHVMKPDEGTGFFMQYVLIGGWIWFAACTGKPFQPCVIGKLAPKFLGNCKNVE